MFFSSLNDFALKYSHLFEGYSLKYLSLSLFLALKSGYYTTAKCLLVLKMLCRPITHLITELENVFTESKKKSPWL